MKLLDIINSPWAIQPEKLTEICEIYATHLKGDKIDIAAIEARTGQELKNKEQGYQVINGAAIIQIEGVIAKKMNLFSQISGGASTQLIARDITEAMADRTVDRLILAIDSPGGSVDGIQELASMIYDLRGSKPILVHSDGIIASAAYWLAAAADAIYISNDLAMVGSIGVVAKHSDISKAEEKRGVKTTEIYAGKYKRIASEFEPLSVEGRESIQEKVDYIYSIFVRDVAQFRSVSEETVLSAMADGKIFIGQQAIDAGLVDGVSTLDRLIADSVAGDATTTIIAREESSMNAKELKEKHPDTYDAVFSEGRQAGTAEAEAAATQQTADAVGKEKGRVLGLVEAHFGAESGGKFKAVVESGVSVDQYAAIKATQPEASASADAGKQQQMLAAINKAGAPNVGSGGDGGAGAGGNKDFLSLVEGYMAAHQSTKFAAMQAVARQNPAAHKAYIEQAQAGGTVH